MRQTQLCLSKTKLQVVGGAAVLTFQGSHVGACHGRTSSCLGLLIKENHDRITLCACPFAVFRSRAPKDPMSGMYKVQFGNRVVHIS